jgi:hypothetical protein
MNPQVIDVRGRSAAAPSAVYALLRDGATWPSFSPIDRFELERSGESEREGLGAIRVFSTDHAVGCTRSREEIVELRPDRRFSYVLLSGLAIRNYRADIDLEPTADGGTAIRWHSTFTGKTPGTGWFYRRVLTGFIEKMVAGLAAHAGTARGGALLHPRDEQTDQPQHPAREAGPQPDAAHDAG